MGYTPSHSSSSSRTRNTIAANGRKTVKARINGKRYGAFLADTLPQVTVLYLAQLRRIEDFKGVAVVDDAINDRVLEFKRVHNVVKRIRAESAILQERVSLRHPDAY